MTVLNEGRHAGEFILSEGNGHISRDTVTVAASQTIEVGTLLAVTSTADGVITVVAYNPAGVDGTEKPAGIAIYPAKTAAGKTAQIAAITRNAEVNGKCIAWPAAADADAQELALADLAAVGIIVR